MPLGLFRELHVFFMGRVSAMRYSSMFTEIMRVRSRAINPAFGPGTATGAIDGHWGQVLNQAAGVAIAWILSAVGTLILLFFVDKTIGLRVTPDDENAGLDLSQHGEEGYDLNS